LPVLHTPDQAFLARQTRILCASYQHWTGLRLIDAEPDSPEAIQRLFTAPFAVASHDTQLDPVFNYANRQALELFGMAWEEITRLPSRYSAEPLAREERARLLQRVERYGYVDDYSGVRIARGGRRFMIQNATVWNLIDEKGARCGQAAMIKEWAAL
jgi:hypothetical protein